MWLVDLRKSYLWQQVKVLFNTILLKYHEAMPCIAVTFSVLIREVCGERVRATNMTIEIHSRQLQVTANFVSKAARTPARLDCWLSCSRATIDPDTTRFSWTIRSAVMTRFALHRERRRGELVRQRLSDESVQFGFGWERTWWTRLYKREQENFSCENFADRLKRNRKSDEPYEAFKLS